MNRRSPAITDLLRQIRSIVAVLLLTTVTPLPASAAPDISWALIELSSFDSWTAGSPEGMLDGETMASGESTPGTNSISGSVIFDRNGDGGFGGSDYGIMGAIVELYEDPNGNGLPDDGLQPTRRTATDWWGNFSFTELHDGDVVIVETDPAGAISTNDVQGAPTDNVVALTLAGFQSWTGALFLDTNIAESWLEGKVWIDADGNGILSPQGDIGQSGVLIELYVDLDANGVLDPEDVLVDWVTTAGGGYYAFKWIPNNNYIVVKQTPADTTSIWDADGSALNGPEAIAVNINGFDSYGNDFLNGVATISGKVRHDLDGDGDLSDSDDGLLGIQVHLYEDTDNNQQFDPSTDALLNSTTTRAKGDFVFAGILDGSYLVVEADPAGAVSTNDSEDAPLQAAGTDNWISVQIVGSDSVNNLRFLDTNVTESTLRGKIWNDTDGDGDRNDPDDFISGVLVALHTDPNGDGNPDDGIRIDVDPSNLKGIYRFNHLVPGNYVLVEEDPDEASSTNDADNDPLGASGTDNTIAVTLGASNISNLDFLDTGASIVSIHGQVLNDDSATNNNQIGPEDQPIGGVEIAITRDTNGNGIEDSDEHGMGTVFTATDGTFLVPGLAEGAYLIEEIDPAGAVSDNDTSGAPNDNIIGVQTGDTDSTGNIFLDDGLSTHAISGSVTTGATSIFGVTITLKNDGGDVIDTAQTSTDGSFRFPNLPDGTYTLTETNPAGTTGGSDSDGGDPNVTTVTLSGADSTDHTFIDLGITLASISGRVLDDGISNNNMIDDSDFPIAGAYVALVRDDNANGQADAEEPLLAEIRTGWDGSYSFDYLLDNNYVVLSVNAAGFSEADADGPANGHDAIAVSLIGGEDSTGNDFLDEGATLRSISGSVTDGTTPIQGVVIKLFTAGGEFIEATGTDRTGNYSFPSLPNGSYLVQETDPDGTTGGSDLDGPANGDNTIAVTISFINKTGQNFVDNFDAQNLHRIVGHVHDDTDGDGALGDSSERPVEGIGIDLFSDADGNGVPDGNECVAQTTTDTNGRYEFNNLPNGAYLLTQTALPGSLSTPTGSAGGTPGLTPVTVAGEDAIGADFATAIDPAGYFYDSLTGEIIVGGGIEVIPSGLGVPTITQSGVTGQYSFVVDSAGTYTMVVTPPPGYVVDPARGVSAPFYDPTGQPDPDTIGSVEDPSNPGYLIDASAGANHFYLVFDLAPGDPLVLSNNIPLRTTGIRSFGQFIAAHSLGAGPDSQPVTDQSGNGGNPDRDTHSNLLEYALTEDPNTGASPDRGGFSVDLVDQASGRIDLKFSRPNGILDLIYTIQTKDSLTGVWTDFISIAAGQEPAASFLVTPNGDGTDSVVYPDIANDVLSGLSTDLGFVRLQVALDADQNGVPDTLPSDGSPVVDHTKTFGWQCIHLNTAQTASYSHPFSNAPVFSGTVDYVQGTAVNVASSSNNFNLSGIIGGNGSHYLQITSGPLEGQRFDIASAAVISLNLVNDPDIFTDTDGVSSLNTSSGPPADADLAGHSFVVVPHLTIDQLFDKNAAFAGQASGIPSQAAKLFFYNNRSDNPGLESFLLVDLGTEQRWIRSNDFAQLADQGSTPVDRCAGSYIHPGLGPITNQFAIGMVADHALAAAFNSGYNLAGSPFPMDQTPTGPDGRAMTVANGFAGGLNPAQASELLFWTGDLATDQSATYIQGYDSYMQLDGGGMQRWIDVSDQNLDDMGLSLLLESHRAPTIKISSGTRIEPHVYPAPFQP